MHGKVVTRFNNMVCRIICGQENNQPLIVRNIPARLWFLLTGISKPVLKIASILHNFLLQIWLIFQSLT